MRLNFFINSLKSFRNNALFFLLFSIIGFSQIENSTRKIELLPPASAALKKLDITPKNPNYFSLKKKEKPLASSRLDKKENFLNPGDIYLKKLNREKDKKPNDYNKGAYLGDVSTGSTYVNILCRDFEYVDGDRIKLLLNNIVIHSNITLTGSYYTIDIDLIEGYNNIEFVALNEGESSPNTAQLSVFDENGVNLSNNKWLITTGYKARLVVFKK